ncbi:hypothetical protein PMIN06_010468 [Paraphaeosphaeria minitans]
MKPSWVSSGSIRSKFELFMKRPLPKKWSREVEWPSCFQSEARSFTHDPTDCSWIAYTTVEYAALRRDFIPKEWKELFALLNLPLTHLEAALEENGDSQDSIILKWGDNDDFIAVFYRIFGWVGRALEEMSDRTTPNRLENSGDSV